MPRPGQRFLPLPPAPIGPAAKTTSATVTSPAATFPWPSPTQQNLLQKLTSMQQCPTSRRHALRPFLCLSLGQRVGGGDIRNVACGVRRSWLLAIQGDDITGAAHRAVYRCGYLSPHTCPHPASSPNTQTTYFQTLPCSPAVYCIQPHSKADARQISLCVGIWCRQKTKLCRKDFSKVEAEPN